MTDCSYCGIVYVGKVCPNCGNINRHKALQSKIMLSIMITFILFLAVLPMVNADIIIPTTSIQDRAGWHIDNKYDFDVKASLGKATIKNTFLGIFPMDTIEDIELKENTYICLEECYARKDITLYTDTKLIDSVRFDGKVRDYKLYLLSKTVPREVKFYECSGKFYGNGSEICGMTGTEIVNDEIWIPYNYEVMPAGSYTVKLVGHKKANSSVEWYITSQGKEIIEWASWAGTSLIIDTHGIPFDTQQSLSNPGGMSFIANAAVMLINATKSNSCTANTSTLWDNDLNISIMNASFVGNNATFNYNLVKGKNYTIVTHNQGSSYLRHLKMSPGGLPYVNVSITWTHGAGMGSTNIPPDLDDTYTQSIASVTTGTTSGNVTLNTPADAYSTNTQSVTFNCSAIQVGATLLNISLWTNETGTFKINQTKELTGTSNTTTFTSNFANGGYLWTCSACDSDNSCGISTVNRTFTIDTYLPNSVTYNATVYETDTETFILNASAATTSASLVYSGTTYTATNSGTIYSASVILPASTGNKSFYWKLNGGVYNSSTYYQNVLPIQLSLCNSSLNVPYLNITFADELTSVAINGTLSPININYYLNSGTVYKTYTLTNTSTLNPNYPLCFGPSNRIINANITASSSMTDYATRSWINNYALTNSTTTKIVYLLSNVDGIYQNIVVTTSSGSTLQGAVVTASTALLGVLASGTTDSNGAVSLWLDANKAHTLATSLTGYPSDSRVINPSASTTVYITLGGSTTYPTSLGYSLTEGIAYSFKPVNKTLWNGTAYNFQFIINSSIWTITNYGFSLYNSTGSIVATVSDVTNGGTLTTNYNVNNNTKMNMLAYYVVNGTTKQLTNEWVIMNSQDTQYSIKFLRDRIITYLDTGFFGLTRGTGLNILCFIIIFVIVGIFSWKYGITNEVIISILTLFLVWFFEYGIGLIDMGSNIAMTAWVLIITVILLIKEGLKLI